ncbi:MAG TPA: hypothetical protein EYP10_12120 [Armatimonadetes bacterium]|nr:hypothetical protein [Armatimonadota bacterium]
MPSDDLTQYFVDSKPTKAGRNQQFSELLQSPGHWKAGVVCTTCHDPHGNTKQPVQLKQPINELCLNCHKAQAAKKITDPTAHMKEHGGSADSKCSDCHMPNGRHLFEKGLAKGKAK